MSSGSGQLPEALFDGQEFVDAFRVLWVYSSANNCWLAKGKVDAVPVANGTNVGLLPSKLKFLLDGIPDKGGGYAIITRPLLAKRSAKNPDGVLFGNIELISDTLNIQCVDSNGSTIGDACTKVAFKEYDALPPGFDINLSDKLLASLCVEVPGGPGPIGQPGEDGDPGPDGTGDGPVGLEGEPGADALVNSKFTGIHILDVDDIYDTAVVKLDIDAPVGKLFVTKARLALPSDDTTPADQLIVNQISRGIRFGDCWDYSLVRLPCRAGDDFDIVDPLIAYYPDSFDPTSVDGKNDFGFVRARLSDLINKQIDFYKGKLDDISAQYDKEIAAFIEEKDAEARKVLDALGDRLTECENITYLEYCIGIEGECNEPPPPPVSAGGPGTGQVSSNDPDCAAFLKFVYRCTDVANSSCQDLGTFSIKGNRSPVLSLVAPGPMGAISQLPPRLASDAELQSTHGPFEAAFRNALANAFVAIPKQPIPFSSATPEFPPGNYIFVYVSGAFRQDKRNQFERQSLDPANGVPESSLVNGFFQDYWVGGDNGSLPLCILEPGGNGACSGITGPLVNMDFGLEIGFVPTSAAGGGVADAYFDQHPFDPNGEIGSNSLELPLSRVDFVGLPPSVIAAEEKIIWHKFPVAHATDAGQLQNTLTSQSVFGRMVVIPTTVPGFFYARVKTAFGVIGPSNNFVLPPITPQGSLGNGQPIRDTSFNRVFFSRPDSFIPQLFPYLNARPIANGEVSFKVVQVNCKDLPPTPASGTVSGGTGVNPNNPPPALDNAGNEISPNPNAAQSGAVL